jgi:NADPH-dependent curcumin reductase
MPQTNLINRAIVLNSRPIGTPTLQNFRLEETSIPTVSTGQVLLRTQYLSLDPYMRGRMSDGPSYAASMAIGDVMVGGTVSRVEFSLHPDYKVGDMVVGYSGWQDYAVSDGKSLTKLNVDKHHPSLALGLLGMPGFTAYMGLLDIGQPKSGETVVVAAASGAVGAVVGQIAKIKECRAVGIAGGPEKCRYAINELGFDACIDHHSIDFAKQLAAGCPKGIDVYFENVGGAVFDAVLPLLNSKGRIPLCGMVANYNDTELPKGPDRLGLLTRTILSKRLKLQGFIIFDDYGPHFPEFFGQMSSWLWEGRIKYREDILEGLENAPEAFMGLLKGTNFGKLIIRVASQ